MCTPTNSKLGMFPNLAANLIRRVSRVAAHKKASIASIANAAPEIQHLFRQM